VWLLSAGSATYQHRSSASGVLVVFTRMRLFLLLSCLFAVATAAGADADTDADLLQLLGEETEPESPAGADCAFDKLGGSAWFWCAPVPR